MRVHYTWHDAAEYPYHITAEVPVTGRGNISIVEIKTHDDIEIDFHNDDDFSHDERLDILWLAKKAGEELESSEEPQYDEDEELSSDY